MVLEKQKCKQWCAYVSWKSQLLGLLLLLLVHVVAVLVVVFLLGTTTLSFILLLLVLLLVLLPGEESLFESTTVGDSPLSPASKPNAPFSNMHHLDLNLQMRLNCTKDNRTYYYLEKLKLNKLSLSVLVPVQSKKPNSPLWSCIEDSGSRNIHLDVDESINDDESINADDSNLEHVR